ncbi:MAG: CRISPR-associated protein [Chloroflexota bacterium]|nr:CRISPR-associated protein [Chloroflexota bacterium]
MWTMYKVILRLRSPLHVGAGQLGNVQRARSYVTGKTLWGALTARITRDKPDTPSPAQARDYRKIGRQVKEQLACSYFYPAVGEEVDVWPWGETADEFAWRYLNTYASTALDCTRHTAEEGGLHEVEYIAPTTRDGVPVNLIGYIFERAGCKLLWRAALPRLQLGGERTYGWGRVKSLPIAEDHGLLFDQWEVELHQARPLVCATSDASRLLAHTLATGPHALGDVRGALEPLVGRETRQAYQHGKEPVNSGVCWLPGAPVPPDTCLVVQAHGIWGVAHDHTT